MTFSKEYLTFLQVLDTVGMTGIQPVMHNGHLIIPVQFLKQLLPKGEDYNESYEGKTNIGCIIQGIKDGQEKTIYIYQVCDHHEAFLETGGNAIGYTTAVPAVTGAIMMLGKNDNGGPWLKEPGVFVPEDQPAKVFLEELAKNGLPWKIRELNSPPIFLMPDFCEAIFGG
jgi:saccharopine dehydrogenase (NAD+, L-lysine-forming)